MKQKELSLYIHIPFCRKKCAYCDFLSASADLQTQKMYVDILIEEIQQKAEQYQSYSVPSIFIGGGTPSVLSETLIKNVMKSIFLNYKIEANAEITIECNPGTVSEQKLIAYRECGINRISFGLQSADDLELNMLGRIHTWDQFLRNFDAARKAGFFNINIDLMYGLPGQSLKSFEDTLSKVLALRPEHISAYGLMIEEGTPFFEQYNEDARIREEGGAPEKLPDEETENQMYELVKNCLAAKGYEQYEISNYAKKGKECMHNVRYWTGKNYLGLGLGSSSYIEEERFENTPELKSYLNHDFTKYQSYLVERNSQIEEFMFLGLRMTNGIQRNVFKEQFGVEIESIYGTIIKSLTKEGLLLQKEGTISLTEYGVSVSNYVLAQFLI